MALTKVHLSNIGESFHEMYGLLLEDDHEYGFNTNLKIVHTGGGRDDISALEYNALLEIWWAAAGFNYMIEDGHFKVDIALAGLTP
jgi:hypothetical protein